MTASPHLACLYLRSSKDRHDLSIDAQRRALHDYAREQGLAVVAEYADAAEHGRDDDRPGSAAGRWRGGEWRKAATLVGVQPLACLSPIGINAISSTASRCSNARRDCRSS